MKITTTKRDLVTALTSISGCIASRSTLPVLQCVLIDSDLGIMGTDLEAAALVALKSTIDEPGAVAVPYSRLLGFCKTLPNTDITLETKGADIIVSASGYKATFRTIDADEFPRVQYNTGEEIEIKGFSGLVLDVIGAASTDIARPMLTGVYLTLKDGRLYAVSADGYQMATSWIDSDISLDLVIPAKSLGYVAKQAMGQSASIILGDNLIQFNVGDDTYWITQLDGTFPNVFGVIPKDEAVASCVVDGLAGAVQSVIAAAGNDANHIKLSSDGNNELIVTSSSNENKAKAVLSVQCPDAFEIAINAKYLVNGLGPKESTLEFRARTKPLVIKHSEHIVNVIMPMHMTE